MSRNIWLKNCSVVFWKGVKTLSSRHSLVQISVCTNLTQSLTMELEQLIIKLLQHGFFCCQSHNLQVHILLPNLIAKNWGVKIHDISRYILKWIMMCKVLMFTLLSISTSRFLDSHRRTDKAILGVGCLLCCQSPLLGRIFAKSAKHENFQGKCQVWLLALLFKQMNNVPKAAWDLVRYGFPFN